MANFKTHLTVGIIASISSATVCWKYQLFNDYFDLIIAILLGVTGSILPDIDAEQSIPTRIIFSILAFVAVILVLANYRQNIHAVILIGGCILAYIVTKFILPKILSKLTYHRGLIHSIPMALLLSLLMTNLFINYGYKEELAIILGCFLGGGFLLHLTLDEIYSVDILGTRLKTSFGTALQFFSITQPLRYITLYIVISYTYLNIFGNKLIFFT